MRPKITFSGLNDPREAKRLLDMFKEAKGRRHMTDGLGDEKEAFLEEADRKEGKFLVEGFDRT